MMRTNHLLVLGLISFLGCETAEETSPVTDTVKKDLVGSCVKAREKAASCRTEIVDEWIAVRAKYNPDIAEALATPDEKAKLRAVALEEFEKDGTGPLEPRVEACTQLATHVPPQVLELFRTFSACTSRSTCDEYRKCVIPAFEQLEIARTGGSPGR